jgi:hypothetical protein
MNPSNRRTFLKVTTAGVVGISRQFRGEAAPALPFGIPPHLGRIVAGTHGYADAHGVSAGGTIRFLISSDVPYHVTFCRLGQQIDDPAGDEILADGGRFPARQQSIHPGSYIHVEKRLRSRLPAFTAEAWVRPWNLDRLQGVVTQEDKQDARGFALGIGKDGYVGFFLGDGVSPDEAVIHRSPSGSVTKGKWYHLVATWDGHEKQIWVNGQLLGRWPFVGFLDPGPHPLRIGAMGDWSETLRFLDGDIAMPAIYDRGLSPQEIHDRFKAGGLGVPEPRGLLGCWSLTEEKGDAVADVSPHRRSGRIINHATWMIGGPTFNPDVPRFGHYDPQHDSQRGHGLRLASDDLYDCAWQETTRWRVPVTARSGVYVARIAYAGAAGEKLAHIPFVVRRAKRSTPAPLLVVCSTNTWRAYNGAPFGVWPNSLHATIGTDGLPNSSGNPPAYCFYRNHASGQGTYQVGFRMPWPVGGPYVYYGGPTRYSHLLRGERFAHAWLEKSGYRFDLVTDDDLHRDPSLLRSYRCVMLNGHSEYWSIPMLDGLKSYLANGGNLAVLSGNSLFWRVSYNDDASIMECRKVDAPGLQVPAERRGECWHSYDGLRGGMLRECGHPGWQLIGLESLGWNNHANPKNFGPYTVADASHPLFHSPEETSLKSGDAFGQGPDGGFPLANGHEFDVRLSTLASLQEQPSPAGTSVPQDPSGIHSLAQGIIPWKQGGSPFDYFFRPIRPKSDQGGEMIYWERPDGGRVFNAGSIGSGWALHSDPRFQTLMRNVLHRFGISSPAA